MYSTHQLSLRKSVEEVEKNNFVIDSDFADTLRNLACRAALSSYWQGALWNKNGHGVKYIEEMRELLRESGLSLGIIGITEEKVRALFKEACRGEARFQLECNIRPSALNYHGRIGSGSYYGFAEEMEKRIKGVRDVLKKGELTFQDVGSSEEEFEMLLLASQLSHEPKPIKNLKTARAYVYLIRMVLRKDTSDDFLYSVTKRLLSDLNRISEYTKTTRTNLRELGSSEEELFEWAKKLYLLKARELDTRIKDGRGLFSEEELKQLEMLLSQVGMTLKDVGIITEKIAESRDSSEKHEIRFQLEHFRKILRFGPEVFSSSDPACQAVEVFENSLRESLKRAREKLPSTETAISTQEFENASQRWLIKAIVGSLRRSESSWRNFPREKLPELIDELIKRCVVREVG
ncbi:MAG: hypothetical protein A3H06_02395 [Candidatus Colwellbacteria bacterium RIFCSPLOWO2_12_FULL_44_13]|uniref:Uncharacterized protein n=3 Tax=Candidatus Colwelliibacteriota TaxID=1817904 RepID=A0A1G1Z8Q3_9BACT|nr:MAG: hypothetical protein A3F24_00095 [Candidatus Colwellbacteria bacterium RIFCSPHIGHO2_12_FULL_44_17]OGY60230.1 MAG: hypothetical protein A3I31_00615 [Candidatus Colwellbacteria bacterium RIFCSPLOWO2_02_FULL_44_20b]OGY62038.1 MAG: hypothetical protein A3H06_02395 [Candidatus Colwellbacteria bacterium RIFCSPLOWO2_12_FULL_44_13]